MQVNKNKTKASVGIASRNADNIAENNSIVENMDIKLDVATSEIENLG